METDASMPLRRSIMALIIIAAAGMMTGRILSASNAKGKWPFFSANDRSRWCTIRSLVEKQTYELDEAIQTPGWNSIDKVRHEGRDGQQHYYSSKPPLYPTLLSGEYWLMHRLFGISLVEESFLIVRLMLIISNLLPMLLYLGLIAAMVEHYGKTDWGRIFIVAAASFGTMLTTFSNSLSNHLPAAVSVALALWAAMRIYRDKNTPLWTYMLAGLGAAFAAANELPALSFFAAITGVIFWKSIPRALLGYFPAATLVVVAFFGTNYLAHDDWRPPYLHRGDGAFITQVDAVHGETLDTEDAPAPQALLEKLNEKEQRISEQVAIEIRERGTRWVLIDKENERRFALVRNKEKIAIHAWDHWYDYPKSHWTNPNKTGVDAGEKSRVIYAMHMLVGHHGIFSLTPLWILSFIGIVWLLIDQKYSLRAVALMILALTLICIVFYIARPMNDRNYGGVSCCFRWLLWFAPLWLVAMIPVVDYLSTRRATRILGSLLLGFSVASASYAMTNPWQHPWFYRFLEYLAG